MLPNADNAIIPMDKLVKYALNPDKEPNKARVFGEALGYNKLNANELAENIRKNLKHHNAKEKPDNGYGSGMKF